MSTETATRNLVYTSSDTDANFSMTLSVGALQQVVPPGGGSPVPGWPIISGTITFEAPTGKISQPINGGLPGQALVAGNSLFGIGAQGPVIGGGSLVISSPCLDGTAGYRINFPTPGQINIKGVSCTPWPPGGG